jgi:hypothetical protein
LILEYTLNNGCNFDKLVIKTESPDKPEDDAMLRDNERQFREIEDQIREAVKEVGDQLKDYEREFHETLDTIFSGALDAVLPDGSEGAGQQPVVPA